MPSSSRLVTTWADLAEVGEADFGEICPQLSEPPMLIESPNGVLRGIESPFKQSTHQYSSAIGLPVVIGQGRPVLSV